MRLPKDPELPPFSQGFASCPTVIPQVPKPGVGNLLSAKGHLNIYNIIRGPDNIINLKISLLYSVKHLINSLLMPWQGLTK